VRIPFALIDRLEHEAVESFRSLTSRGSEIGGLLVGEVTSGNPMVVSISDYDLIACDYSRGPLYRLSDADMGRFEHAMQQRLAAGRGVAGFFRSHTRKGISLDADDLTFFQARFRDPQHIALLVRPFATKASTAGIFIWENGQVNADASYLEFPFRSSELGPGQAPLSPEPKAAAPSAPPPPAAKNAARAQIVPIASRREISIPAEPKAEPAPPAPVAAAPAPAPAATVTPAAPAVEQKSPAAPEKQSKIEKPGRYEKYERSDKPAKPARSEPPAAPAAKVAAPPVKTEKVETKPAISTPGFTEPEAKSGKGMKLVLAAAATMAVLVGLFVYPGVLRTGSKQPATAAVVTKSPAGPLQLNVERSAGELLVTWNPDLPAVKNATKGVLAITDGEVHENVDMDLTMIARGGIVYSPTGSRLNFEMQLSDKAGKVTSDSVNMVRPPSPLQEPSATNAKNTAPAAAKPVPGAPAATAPTAEPAAEQPVAAKPAPRQFQTSSLASRIRPPAATDMPDAPTVSAGSANTASPWLSAPASARPTAPTAPAPAVANPVTTTTANDSRPKAGGNLQPAVLVYRKPAEYPRIAKQTGAKGIVKLNATIGTDGSIKKVKVLSGHPMLIQAARDAVMQWRYTPTLLNGQPVEAETEVMVNFVPDQR
jgi:protein TonB